MQMPVHQRNAELSAWAQLILRRVGDCLSRALPLSFLQRAAKSLLGLRETTAVSVRLSEPPHTAISDVADIFRQPCHIVSLTLSPLPDATLDGEEERSPRRALRDRQRRECVEQQQQQLPASQGRRKAKCSGKEMERLLSQLNDVSQCLERTQHECEEIARRCGERREEGRKRERDEPDYAAEDSRVEHLLQVAEGLTAQIILRRQQKSPSPPGKLSPCRCTASFRVYLCVFCFGCV